ncbi:MAG: hypothetical protein MI975_04635 [Cytophagales bacterium]|nr:hypothetical protein [Cytophagales bacterium]
MDIPNTNCGTQSKPELRTFLVQETLMELPESEIKNNEEHYKFFLEYGFTGIQNGDTSLCQQLGLQHAHSGRIDEPGDTQRLIDEANKYKSVCVTVHAGTGLESDKEIDALVEDILLNAHKNKFPVYLETHRSTITQDMYRTVKMVERYPDIRFNGDFSHWYTGQEMRYGKFSKMGVKFEFITPVFERVRFMHGRIGNGGHMQVDITRPDMSININHFKEMWVRSIVGFLRSAQPGDYLIFAPELLGHTPHYVFEYYHRGKKYQEGNRIEQALFYKNIIEDCWQEAQNRIKK